MNLKIKIAPVLFLLSLITLFSCKKEEGKNGKAIISGTIQHHADPIPFAAVFIHYGSLESPGNKPEQYQDSVKADANGKFEFPNLQKGKYYLYSTGWDSKWNPPSTVFGGLPVEIFQRKEKVSVIVPVSE